MRYFVVSICQKIKLCLCFRVYWIKYIWFSLIKRNGLRLSKKEKKRKEKKGKKNYTQNITLHVCRLRKVLRVYGIKVWEPARLIVTSNNCHRVSFCKLILLKRRPNFIYIFDIFISLLRIKRSKKNCKMWITVWLHTQHAD